MTQLALFAAETRYELPPARWTWLDAAGQRQVRTFGARCIDEAWPWWHPAIPQ